MAIRKGNLMSVRDDVKVLDATLRDGGLCNNFRFSDDFCTLRADTNELFIMTDTQGSACAKIENGFGAVGFPLRVFAKEHVQSVRKDKFFALVISEILKE